MKISTRKNQTRGRQYLLLHRNHRQRPSLLIYIDDGSRAPNASNKTQKTKGGKEKRTRKKNFIINLGVKSAPQHVCLEAGWTSQTEDIYLVSRSARLLSRNNRRAIRQMNASGLQTSKPGNRVRKRYERRRKVLWSAPITYIQCNKTRRCPFGLFREMVRQRTCVCVCECASLQ